MALFDYRGILSLTQSSGIYLPSPLAIIIHRLPIRSETVMMQMAQDISNKVQEEYRKHMTSRLLLVDALLAFAFTTGVVQVLSQPY